VLWPSNVISAVLRKVVPSRNSTLNGGIKELEARLGITLFERSHRHVMLTPLGKEIATRAQRLLVDAEEL
jgi:LysR family hydrogen peroxide-inducible transcriptional activator